MLMPSIFGQNLFDDFFDDFTRPMGKAGRPNPPAPPVMRTDVRESDKGYVLEIDLPGYKKEDVKAELKDGYLIVNAVMKQENEEKDRNDKYIRRERYYGSCSRSFYVGKEVKLEDIKAKFEDGILNISVPKKEAAAEVEESKYIAIEG